MKKEKKNPLNFNAENHLLAEERRAKEKSLKIVQNLWIFLVSFKWKSVSSKIPLHTCRRCKQKEQIIANSKWVSAVIFTSKTKSFPFFFPHFVIQFPFFLYFPYFACIWLCHLSFFLLYFIIFGLLCVCSLFLLPFGF